MTTFELQTKVKANKALDFADKAILNDIISYINNGKTFHATNEYLAECWGSNVTAIKRAIRTLKGYGLITIRTVRKKHMQGEGAWYNKRYIEVDFVALEAFLEGKGVVAPAANTSIKPIEPKSVPQPQIEDDSDEPVLGVFPEQDNEFTRAIAQVERQVVSQNNDTYNHEAVLELVDSDDSLTQTVKRAADSGKPIDSNYTSGLFTYIIQKSQSYKELYHAIISKKMLCNVA